MTDYGETQSSATTDDLEQQTRILTAHMSNIVTSSTHEIVKELKEAKLDITFLQNEMNERTKSMEDLLITRKNTQNVYYLGLLTGIVGIGAGFSNIIYGIAGAGVAFTAIVGICEAKKNKW